MNGCRQMIQAYINKHRLDKVNEDDGAPATKGGQIRLDPLLYNILQPKPAPHTETIRKDAIFKSIGNCSNAAFVLTPVDPNQAVSAEEASTFTLIKTPASAFHPGKVPAVKIEALKYRNKKITRISGLEVYQIDLQEFARYLRNKCQASVTIHEITPNAKQGAQVFKG